MCLDRITTHETYHFFLALPLEVTPAYTKQCGTIYLQICRYDIMNLATIALYLKPHDVKLITSL